MKIPKSLLINKATLWGKKWTVRGVCIHLMRADKMKSCFFSRETGGQTNPTTSTSPESAFIPTMSIPDMRLLFSVKN
jgi:hypothetical protein